MTTLPVTGFFADPARTNGEAKAGLDDTVDVARELPGGAAETELTTAAGVVTPTGGRHTIDTEADAPTDDLTNIDQSNHPNGRLLLLRSAANGRTVVVKHAALGAGQVLLANSADFALDDTGKWLLLARQDAAWVEVLRSHGGDAAAARGFIAAAGLADANVFTNTQSWAKGADVASAAALAFGDGNAFDVTGVVPITSIVSKGVGSWVLLQFDAALTLTHHPTDLILPGGANITTAAGDLAMAHEYVAGKWRVFYQRATGSAVDTPISMATAPPEISNGTVAANDIDVEAKACRDELDTANMPAGVALGKQIDVNWAEGGTPGLPKGGFPSGLTLANDTWYRFFKIAKPDGTVDAGFDIAADASNLLADATGYTLYRRIGWVRRGTAANIAFRQIGKDFFLASYVQHRNSVSNPTTAQFEILLVPPNHVAIVQCALYNSGVGTWDAHALITDPASVDQTPSSSLFHLKAHSDIGNTWGQSQEKRVRTNSSSQIRWRQTINNSTAAIQLGTIGWEDTRGRDL